MRGREGPLPGDFEALERLRRLAIGEKVPQPAQRELGFAAEVFAGDEEGAVGSEE